MLRKEISLAFLLSILLFVSIDISIYNHIVLGQQDSKDDNEGGGEEAQDNEDSKDDNEGGGDGGGKEEGGEEVEDFEETSLN